MRLENVERVIRAAAVTLLPEAPEIVLGILDVGGVVVPVLDVRKRFRRPAKRLSPDDQFVVARAGRRTVALVVDATSDVVAQEGLEELAAQEVAPGADYVAGVTRTRNGLVLIHDLETFLSLEEERTLAVALRQGEV